MGRTKAHASLGLSLVKKKRTQWDRATNVEHSIAISAAENATAALKSVTEESSYDEFIATATLANKEFTAEKLNVKFVAMSTGTDGDDEFTDDDKRLVVVPRRPKWTKEMTAEELDTAEREAFLEWRRAMAHLQNREGITPFERNIEVWRQLWRVVERSDVIVQIVDARNPLLYRCEDLEAYVSEMGKKNILLINKADFLSEKQRVYWSEYFTEIKLPHVFYSAAAAAKKVEESISEEDHVEKENNSSDTSSNESGNEEDADDEGDDGITHHEYEDDDNHKQQDQQQQQPITVSGSPILTREELVEFLRRFKGKHTELFAVGLVGYPNVGKSSTINSLMAAKLTSVSSTPGKTKHFQTLFLEDDILLCDCPGLVMPAFGGSKGEMVLGGILPIDQLTSYHAATDLLTKRIPTLVLQDRYGVNLPPNYTNDDFLNAYAALRGFMTVRGIPDCSRASRKVLKDYVDGKICYCLPPPNISLQDFQPSNFEAPAVEPDDIFPQSSVLKEKRPMAHKTRMEKALDRQFFAPAPTIVHYKGKHLVSSGISSAGSSSSISSTADGKSWKKHGNKNKREKLRRIYRHLDVE